MFHTVAPRYDFITRAFSTGWTAAGNATAVARAALPRNAVVLDLASGTGDFSKLVTARDPGARPIAVDLTERMLQLARSSGVPEAVCADACVLPFPDAHVRRSLHRLRPAQLPESRPGDPRNPPRHPPRRTPGESRFFPPREPHPADVSTSPTLCAGRILGLRPPRPPPRLHVYPRFAPGVRDRRRVLDPSPRRPATAKSNPAPSSSAASRCTGRSSSLLGIRFNAESRRTQRKRGEHHMNFLRLLSGNKISAAQSCTGVLGDSATKKPPADTYCTLACLSTAFSRPACTSARRRCVSRAASTNSR